MKVTFYGTRGSIPVCEPEFIEFGGNTTSLLLSFESGRIAIIDAGTGLRKLGNDLIKNNIEQFDNIFIGLTHTHWDHIQGFPYFKPAYDSRRNFSIGIYGVEKKIKDLYQIFNMQMQKEFFPVTLDGMGANFKFWQSQRKTFTSDTGVTVISEKINHPGGAYGYRIEENGKSLTFCTDVEHDDGIAPNVVKLAMNTDLLIHDAQYTEEELKTRKGWGHSTWQQAVEVARQSNAKKLVLFHHDPDHNDVFLRAEEKKCQAVFPNSIFAREGMEIEI